MNAEKQSTKIQTTNSCVHGILYLLEEDASVPISKNEMTALMDAYFLDQGKVKITEFNEKVANQHVIEHVIKTLKDKKVFEKHPGNNFPEHFRRAFRSDQLSIRILATNSVYLMIHSLYSEETAKEIQPVLCQALIFMQNMNKVLVLSDRTKKTYDKLFGEEPTVDAVKNILTDYTKGGTGILAMLTRLITFHWRNNVKQVDSIVKGIGKTYKTPESIMHELGKINANKEGSLARRMGFLKFALQSNRENESQVLNVDDKLSSLK